METINYCPVCHSSNLQSKLTCQDHTVSKKEFNLNVCTDCRLLITTPRPKTEELGEYYVSSKYISHTGKSESLIDKIYLFVRDFTLRRKLRLVNKYTKHSSPRLLDFGCGTGEFINICKSDNWTVCGVEPSENARTKSEHLNDQKIYSSIDESDETEFDAITLWHVLEHVTNLEDTMKELSSRLKENGTMFIAVPNYESYDAHYYKSLWAAYDVPRHLWHFSKKNMALLLQKNGLTLTTIKPMKLDSFYVSMLSEKYKNKSSSLIKLFKAVRLGWKSNSKAAKTGNYSSLIYIATK